MNWLKLVNDAVIIVLLAFQAMIAVAVANPEHLGLSLQILAWATVANVGIGILLNRLQTIGQQP